MKKIFILSLLVLFTFCMAGCQQKEKFENKVVFYAPSNDSEIGYVMIGLLERGAVQGDEKKYDYKIYTEKKGGDDTNFYMIADKEGHVICSDTIFLSTFPESFVDKVVTTINSQNSGEENNKDPNK